MAKKVERLALWLAVCALSCSAASSGNSPPDPGGGDAAPSAGGAAGAGGNAGGSAGTGGAPTAVPMSKRQACREYLRAYYGRDAECRGMEPYDDYRRVPVIEQCPDVLFSEGSARTIEGVFACAEDWRTFPCDDLLRGFVPACAIPGTLAAGEPCLWNPQCASAACSSGSGTMCSACLSRVGSGESCAGDVRCPDGQECYTSTCEDTIVPIPKVAGESCLSDDCAQDLMCLETAGGARTCQALPGAGAPCGTSYMTHFCGEGTGCNSMLVCQVPPTAGHPCATSDRATSFCAIDHYCDAASVCRRLPVEGEPCGVDSNGQSDLCDPQFVCDSGTCAARPTQGEACGGGLPHAPGTLSYFEGRCAEGLWCNCDVSGCMDGICTRVALEGERCDAPYTVCEDGTECRSGRCVALESLGIFEAICGGS